ncbi:MAG: tripartite tricarboxylate transporter substrate binding protein [Burkholderiaceae bacterium]
MKSVFVKRRGIAATLLATTAAAFALTIATPATPAGAADKSPIENLHFLIPGGAGGGWDGTARGTGEALTKSGLVSNASFENMSGGGGGKAIGYLIENADSNKETIMVGSTPFVIRGLTGRYKGKTFRDLTMIAGTIGDYAALVVNKNSPIKDFKQLVAQYKKDPRSVALGGGSVPGGMDHLVAAMIMKTAGAEPTKVKYIPYDAGGKAMAALLSGEIKALSTGFSEAVELAKAGEVRIIGITAAERIDTYKEAPTFKEQGVDAQFVNWRGFFAAPGLDDARATEVRNAIAAMYDTPEWEAVRKRNGWVNIHNPGDKFVSFLNEQEKTIGSLMKELGFL